MVTLKDIAKEAGVSTVTVSNVINGQHKRVSQKTIAIVEEIIRKYNYVPNATARSLASKQSKIIGVVIPYVRDTDNFLENTYNAEVLGVIERVIRSNGYYLMVRCVGRCTDIIPTIGSWNVDGVIFFGALKEDAEKILESVKLPMIFMDTYYDDLNVNSVRVNDYKGGYLAARYLTGRGHTKIAFAGPRIRPQSVIGERFRGYEDALLEKGLKADEKLIFLTATYYECGVDVGKEIAFCQEHPTAVVCMSDILALGIMEGLRLSGQKVPEDISVIGFDNLPECRYSSPQLTSISQNITKKAESAADSLFRMIREKTEVEKNEIIDVELIERQSVRSMIN